MAYCTTSPPVAGGGSASWSMPTTPGNLFTYEESDLDVPAQAIILEPDEADQVAEILHNQPITDRLLALERRMRELIEERGAV